MKKIKRYLSILLVLSMMLCCTSMFTVNAAQVTETEDVVVDTEANLGGEDELRPMMARSCTSFQMFQSNKAANLAIINCFDKNNINPGYSGAEDFKADWGFTSNANLGYDKNTRQIYIFPNIGAPIATGYYW
jgi:hypothetical protein